MIFEIYYEVILGNLALKKVQISCQFGVAQRPLTHPILVSYMGNL